MNSMETLAGPFYKEKVQVSCGNIVFLYLDKQEDESKDHGGLVAVVVRGGVSVGPAGVGGEHHHRALDTLEIEIEIWWLVF